MITLFIVYLIFGFMVSAMLTPSSTPDLLFILVIPAIFIDMMLVILFLEINFSLNLFPNLKNKWEEERKNIFNF